MTHPSIYVRDSATHGMGVFTRARIEAGERILACGGKRVKAADVPPDARAIQVDVDEYLVEIPGEPVFDDYFNHSCEPNVGFVDGTPTAYALRAIEPGEELTFDYSTAMNEPGWELPCRCGTKSCRGVIRSHCDLAEADQLRLSGISLAYLRTAPTR